MRMEYIQEKHAHAWCGSGFPVMLFLKNKTLIPHKFYNNLEQYFIPGQVFDVN